MNLQSLESGQPSAAPEATGEAELFREGVRTLILHQLQCILAVTDLESNGQAVCSPGEPDGSPAPDKAGSDRQPVQEKKAHSSQFLPAYQYMEPRLPMIGRFLKFVAIACELYVADTRVDIDGFRLAKHSFWARYPVGSLVDALGCICSYCDARCEFCFRKGSPFSRLKNKMLTASEAQSLLQHYDLESGLGLPLPLHDTGEVFLNPDLFDILTLLRRKDPQAVINDLTTNGNFLNTDTISALARLKPVFLVVSVNAMELPSRKKLMRGNQTQMCTDSLPLLRQQGIPFIGSLVPWPSIPLEEIERTIRFIDSCEAYLIRVCLPSFSGFSFQQAPFDTESYWHELAVMIEGLRGELTTPMLIQPSWYLRQEIKAHVDGVVKNSPAFKAGIRFGDRIVSVNESTVVTRENASKELVRVHKEHREALLRVERDGAVFDVLLQDFHEPSDDLYPYKPVGHSTDPKMLFGIHCIDGFPFESLIEMATLIQKHPEANNILLFTTKLGRKLLSKAVHMLMETGEYTIPLEKIRITMAEHRYWGGNIVVGDLHVVQDYIDHIRRLQSLGYQPDLVLIPSSFTLGQWKLDVLGNSALDIERATDCRVELITTPPVKI
jgi:wyosine [tRNA(Phe)-imidazoG37] synthetase (radical SAM superfamily)